MKRTYYLIFIVVSFVAWEVADNYWVRWGAMRGAKAALSELRATVEKLESGGKTCGIGVRSVEYNMITSLLDHGVTHGLHIADKMLKINGESVVNSRSRILSEYEPGDELELRIMRESEEINLNVICVDETERDQAYVDLFNASANGWWQECIDQSYVFDKKNNGPIVFSARTRNRCSDAKRCGAWGCEPPTEDEAKIVFELISVDIAESITSKILDDRRPRMQAKMSWLEENGFQKFADDLESQLRKAESGLE